MKLIVDNLAVEYADQGHGPIWLFLHGWQDTLHTFDPLLPFLTDVRAVRLDLPGFGGSELKNYSWTIDDYARFVGAFIAKLGLDVDTLVGHSFGGRVIIRGLATNQFRARRAVLIGSAGLAKVYSLRNRSLTVVAKIGKILTVVPPLRWWRGSLRRRLYDAAGSDYLRAGGMKHVYLNAIRQDLSADAAALAVPTLLIWGERDTVTPLADGRRLAQLIPHARLEILPGASHYVHQEQPAVVAGVMKGFA